MPDVRYGPAVLNAFLSGFQSCIRPVISCYIPLLSFEIGTVILLLLNTTSKSSSSLCKSWTYEGESLLIYLMIFKIKKCYTGHWEKRNSLESQLSLWFWSFKLFIFLHRLVFYQDIEIRGRKWWHRDDVFWCQADKSRALMVNSDSQFNKIT